MRFAFPVYDSVIYTYSCQRHYDIAATCCQVSVVVSSASDSWRCTVCTIGNASCLIIITIMIIIVIIINYLWRPIWQEPGAAAYKDMDTLRFSTHAHTH